MTPLIAILALLVAGTLCAFTYARGYSAGHSAGYVMGERHGRENERAEANAPISFGGPTITLSASARPAEESEREFRRRFMREMARDLDRSILGHRSS